MTQGKNLKALRAKFGLTQAQLADALEVTTETVTRWENERINMRARHIDRLCELFNLCRDDIVSENNGLGAYSEHAAPLMPSALALVNVPLFDTLTAADLTATDLLATQFAPVPVSVKTAHPVSLCLRVSGATLDRLLPDGAFVLLDTTQTTPTPRRVYAVSVDNAPALLCYVHPLFNGVQLVPASTDSTITPRAYDFSDPECPTVDVLGAVVFAGLPFDYADRYL